MSFHRIASAAVFGLTAAVFAPPAVASPSTDSSTIRLAQAVEEGEHDLVAFAAATVRILDIQRAMQAAVAEADQQDAAQIQAEAQAAMVSAVEEEGLTVDQYNTIAQLTQTDPEVSQTVQQLIQQQTGG